jgi:hypothetical protein
VYVPYIGTSTGSQQQRLSSGPHAERTEDSMTTTPDSGGDSGPGEPVDLGKSGGRSEPPQAEQPFDPYRFGKPDHPVPPEFAPPGYADTGYRPAPQPAPYAGQQPYPTEQSAYPTRQPPSYPGPDYQYGAPYPPQYPTYPQPRTGNGKAVAALVFGILSIVFFWLSILDGVLIILALIFGILGLSESRRQGGNGRGLAVTGLVCMGIGAVAAILWTSALVHAVNQCGGFDTATGSTTFEQCVSDHLPWS